MSFEQVKEFFLAAGAADRLLELPQSSATVELAAKAIGCRPERIAKTLSFLVGGRPVLFVAAGDARIDNRKFRSEGRKEKGMLKIKIWLFWLIRRFADSRNTLISDA